MSAGSDRHTSCHMLTLCALVRTFAFTGTSNTNTGTLGGNHTNLGGGDVRSLESGTHPTAGHRNFVGGHEVP
jgi:hypothetical protein